MAAGLRARVEAAARDLGFDLFGIASPDPSAHGGFLREWLGEGRHGGMEWLARPDAVERREDPSRTMPDVRSVVVVGHEYGDPDEAAVASDPSRGVIARYARGRDYHRVMGQKLRALLRRIAEVAGRPVEGRWYVDTGPLLERELAWRAGLGWFGRNTMLIHPRRGSYFFLGVVLVDLDLEPDAPIEADHCGTCRRCIDACPTGALLGRDERGAPVIDARLCISYLTIELRGPIPPELRPAIGNRVFGCDICQEVCPFNRKFAGVADEPGYAARGPGQRPVGVEGEGGRDVSAETRRESTRSQDGPPRREGRPAPRAAPWHPGTEAPSLVELMRMTPEDWEEFSRGSAIRRAGYAGFKRNVAVALGNWLAQVEEPPGDAVAALREALGDEEPLVREHAAWALSRIGMAE